MSIPTIILRKNLCLHPDPTAIIIAVDCRAIARGRRIEMLAPIVFDLASILLCARGRLLSVDDLIDGLYGHREDGGPSSNSASVHMCRLRPIFSRLGVGIETVHGQGYRLQFPEVFARRAVA